MTKNILSSAFGRAVTVVAFPLMVVLFVSCSNSEGEVTEETAATSTTESPVPTTTPEPEATPPTTDPVGTTSTTEPFPAREVLDYFEDMQGLTVRVGELVVDMRAANNDWDNRSETGVSYGDTEAAMDDVAERALDLRDDISLIEPPPDRGLPVEHQTAWVALGQMADAAADALAGLRSPDTGDRRRGALAEFLVAFERFNGAFDRIVEIIGVGAGISAPSTTAVTTATTSTRAATTTTSTTAPAATTSTTEAPATTSTTEAATTSTTEAATTSTTEAATTSTTEAPPTTDPTTLPPKPDVGYSVIEDGDSSYQGAARTWLVVQVDAGATKAELAQIGNRLAYENRVAKEYQALLIYFVRFPQGVDTLGTWIDAPFGDWNRAAEVEADDYSQHQVDDRTVEKDWSLLPTDAQVDLYRRYMEYRDNRADTGELLPDDELIPLAAEELQVTIPDINDAIEAWEAWVAR